MDQVNPKDTVDFPPCTPRTLVGKPNLMFGNWSKKMVMADFDDTYSKVVKYWGFRALNWFHLWGFLVLKSSERIFKTRCKGKTIGYKVGNYHLMFDRPVRWEQNLRILNWLLLESGNDGLGRYAIMQAIKRTSTLRIGFKGKKSPPRIVFRYGSQDHQIAIYLDIRRFILNGIKKNWGINDDKSSSTGGSAESNEN